MKGEVERDPGQVQDTSVLFKGTCLSPRITWWVSGTLLGSKAQRKDPAGPQWLESEQTEHPGHFSQLMGIWETRGTCSCQVVGFLQVR